MLSETLDKAIEIREIAKQLTQRVQEIQEALCHVENYPLIRKIYTVSNENNLHINPDRTFTAFYTPNYKNWLSGLQIELKNREIKKLEEEQAFYKEALSDLQIMLDAL
jgi:hypothetical protein